MKITPALAGKRLYYQPMPCLYRDHPRTRGEKYLAVAEKNDKVGSPPHSRGKDGY